MDPSRAAAPERRGLGPARSVALQSSRLTRRWLAHKAAGSELGAAVTKALSREPLAARDDCFNRALPAINTRASGGLPWRQPRQTATRAIIRRTCNGACKKRWII